jgi:hypothetical protein
VGSYVDASYAWHGFLRAKGGRITTFDAPGAGTGVGQGTHVASINPAGAITGFYYDENYAVHGFLRSPSPPPCRSGERMQPWEKCDDHEEHQH